MFRPGTSTVNHLELEDKRSECSGTTNIKCFRGRKLILCKVFPYLWRKSDIRLEHEFQGCKVAKRVLPGTATPTTSLLEDALMRDADRSWRFDRAGIALASGWFDQTPDYYTDRLEYEIIPELITEAAIAMAHADLQRSRDLLKTAVLR